MNFPWTIATLCCTAILSSNASAGLFDWLRNSKSTPKSQCELALVPAPPTISDLTDKGFDPGEVNFVLASSNQIIVSQETLVSQFLSHEWGTKKNVPVVQTAVRGTHFFETNEADIRAAIFAKLFEEIEGQKPPHYPSYDSRVWEYVEDYLKSGNTFILALELDDQFDPQDSASFVVSFWPWLQRLTQNYPVRVVVRTAFPNTLLENSEGATWITPSS